MALGIACAGTGLKVFQQKYQTNRNTGRYLQRPNLPRKLCANLAP